MPKPVDQPNIVIIAIDTLRADHLRCYGYTKDTAPEIEALAGESIVFDTAIAAGIPTMPSFTTLNTGLHPYIHGIVAHIGHRNLSEKILFLPQLAKERGYVTVACDNLVVQGEGRGGWFARGYDHYSGFLYKPFSRQSNTLTQRALRFLQEYAHQPLFLFMHYWDPHTPYGPQPPYDTLHYEPGSGLVDLGDVRRIQPEYYDAFIGDMKLRYPNDYAYVLAQYDGEISQVDAEVGCIVRAIKEQGDWDNTIFVFMSDHGECFGEGNFYFDHHGLYDAVTRIALMLHLPGNAARRVKALVSTEDILPTLADLAQLPTPPYPLTGTSMLPLLNGTTNEIRPYVVSAESTRQASLALRTPEWKLIQPIIEDSEGQSLPDFYGRARCADPLLFNLQSDPAEQHDLSLEQPDKLAAMGKMLTRWREEMAHITGRADPIQSHGLSLPYSHFMERMFARR